jgi:hypothetical protein
MKKAFGNYDKGMDKMDWVAQQSINQGKGNDKDYLKRVNQSPAFMASTTFKQRWVRAAHENGNLLTLDTSTDKNVGLNFMHFFPKNWNRINFNYLRNNSWELGDLSGQMAPASWDRHKSQIKMFGKLLSAVFSKDFAAGVVSFLLLEGKNMYNEHAIHDDQYTQLRCYLDDLSYRMSIWTPNQPPPRIQDPTAETVQKRKNVTNRAQLRAYSGWANTYEAQPNIVTEGCFSPVAVQLLREQKFSFSSNVSFMSHPNSAAVTPPVDSNGIDQLRRTLESQIQSQIDRRMNVLDNIGGGSDNANLSTDSSWQDKEVGPNDEGFFCTYQPSKGGGKKKCADCDFYNNPDYKLKDGTKWCPFFHEDAPANTTGRSGQLRQDILDHWTEIEDKIESDKAAKRKASRSGKGKGKGKGKVKGKGKGKGGKGRGQNTANRGRRPSVRWRT